MRKWWQRFQAWLNSPKADPCPPHVWRWVDDKVLRCRKCDMWAGRQLNGPQSWMGGPP